MIDLDGFARQMLARRADEIRAELAEAEPLRQVLADGGYLSGPTDATRTTRRRPTAVCPFCDHVIEVGAHHDLLGGDCPGRRG